LPRQYKSTKVQILTPKALVVAFEHNAKHTPLLINGKENNYWTAMLAYAYQAAALGAPVVTIPIGMPVQKYKY